MNPWIKDEIMKENKAMRKTKENADWNLGPKGELE